MWIECEIRCKTNKMANCDHVAAVHLSLRRLIPWLKHIQSDAFVDLNVQMRFYHLILILSTSRNLHTAAGDDGRWCYCHAITNATCYYIVLVSFIVDYVLARILPLKFNCSRYLVSVLFWQFSLSLNCYAVLSNIQPNRKYTPTHPHTHHKQMKME